MKILYHHRTASQDGQAVHIVEMIAALRDLGHEVCVVAPGAADPRPMGGEFRWVSRLKGLLPKVLYEVLELTYSLVAYLRLVRAVREFRPDVIYERYNLFLLSGAMLKHRYGIPLLLEVNSPLAYERSRHGGGLALARFAHWTEGWVWRSANFVLPVTAVLGRQLEASGVMPERIVVIHNGINLAHFSAAPDPSVAKSALELSEHLVLGFTGFVRDWHGVDRVISWMASPQAPKNVHLLVVGDGPARAALEALAVKLGLAQSVTFTGVVPRDLVPALVAAFDIALQPAVVPYASPLKLLEYLALGKAIIAPRESNLLELLTDGENALLFAPAMPCALEAALSNLSRDSAMRELLAIGARATITRLNLTWPNNARRVVSLAESVIGLHNKDRSGTE